MRCLTFWTTPVDWQAPDIVLTAKTTLKLRIEYGARKTIVHTSMCLIYNGVGVYLIHFYIPWKAKQNESHQDPNTPQSYEKTVTVRKTCCTIFPPQGLEYPNLIWNVTKLSIRYFTVNVFFHRFIRGIFPAEQEVVQWHSSRVAIRLKNVKRREKPTTENSKEKQEENSQQPVEGVKNGPVQVTRRIILKRFPQHPVLETKLFYGLLEIDRKIYLKTSAWSPLPTAKWTFYRWIYSIPTSGTWNAERNVYPIIWLSPRP